MTIKQIEIGNHILVFFAENSWRLSDQQLNLKMKSLGYKSEEYMPVYTMLIDDYKLLRRNISDSSYKHLTKKGFSTTEKGLAKYLKWRWIEDFSNGYLFKIIQFVIPTSLAVIALLFNSKIDINNNQYTRQQIDSIINNKSQISININDSMLIYRNKKELVKKILGKRKNINSNGK